MFFRDKTSKKAKRPTLQLVENYRDGNRILQVVVVSLGVEFNIPLEDRKPVARAIENKLQGNLMLFDRPEINAMTERIVKIIRNENRWHAGRAKPTDEDKNETKEVYINQVEHEDDRLLGPLLIGHEFWQRLGLGEILEACSFNGEQLKTAELSILNRLIAQGSEHSIPEWIKTVAAEELIAPRSEDWGDDRFYVISDLLLKHQQTIEEQLYQRELDLFNLNNSIFLYDLTNTYFEGLCEKNPQAEFSKNQKEKRTDCRQIVISLELNSEGFIRRHHVFNGKMTDVKSLVKILAVLERDFQGQRFPTIVMDRGVGSEENINLLKSKGFKYIVASRTQEEKQYLEEFVHAEFNNIKEDKIDVYLKKTEGDWYLLCKSQLRKGKEQSMRNRAEEKLDLDLAKLSKLIASGKRIDPFGVERSIGRIKERHARVAHYYSIEYTPLFFDYEIPAEVKLNNRFVNSLKKLKEKVTQYKINHIKLVSKLKVLADKYPQDYAKLSIELTEPVLVGKPMDEKRADLANLDGNYLIRTNRDDLSDVEIWKTYVLLTRVEAAFRNLKTDLKLRPNYHQLEKRVEGHVFITILAYHLLHAIEQMLRENNCFSSWATIQRIVTNHTYSSIILPATDGSVIHLRKPGRPESIHRQIYEKLGIKTDSLPTMKIVAKK